MSFPAWSEFATEEPRLASTIRALIHQYGQGMGYLATIRPDGGPRIHPVSPIVADGGLYCFVIDSPKRRDLELDGRYALHSFPSETSDVEAYLAGRARPVINVSTVDTLARRYRASARIDWTLFELSVEVAMVHRLEPDTAAQTWRAGQPSTRETPARQPVLLAA